MTTDEPMTTPPLVQLPPGPLLVVQTAFLGDGILGLSVVQALMDAWPMRPIHYLVRQGHQQLLAGYPATVQPIVWDKTKAKYRHLWQLLRQLRTTRYAAVVNLHRHASSGVLTGLSGAGVSVGFRENPMSGLFTHRVPHGLGLHGGLNGGEHETARNHRLLIAAGLTNSYTPFLPKLYPSTEDVALAKQLAPAQPYGVLAPASVWATKQWPAEHWAQLARLLLASGQVPVLIGSAADAGLCNQIAAQAPGSVVLAGQLSLLASAALMQRATRVYTNDSGPMHIASAVGVPTTAIFCSTLPEYGFGPLAPDSTVVQRAPLSCRPCGLHGHAHCPQGHFRCGWSLTPEQVLDNSEHLFSTD